MGKPSLTAVAAVLSMLSVPLAHATDGGLDALPTPTPAGHNLGRRAAESSTSSIITIRAIDLDLDTAYASVITADPTATSYLVSCPTDATDTDCDAIGTGLRILAGQSTLEMHATANGTANDLACNLGGFAADCHQNVTGPAGQTVQDMHFNNIAAWTMVVTVTAGFEALTSSGSASTSATSTGDVSSTGGGGSPTTTGTGAPAPTGTGPAQTAKTNSARMAAVTGNAVVAGLAAVWGWMLVV